ncbi:MAG: hypothetical protein K2N51_13190 [Lachnospiraceae bacterium]|nr:hypothetical protein [Lachnospiraceae bacterium]
MKKYFCCCLVLSMLIVSFIFADGSLAYNQTFNCSVTQPLHYALPTEEDTVSPCSDDIRWCYKVIDGVLYRRKYNYTKKTWIGKWERA